MCVELTDYECQVLCDKFDPRKEGRWVFIYDVVSLEDSIRFFTVLSTIRLYIFFTKQFLILNQFKLPFIYKQ